MAQANAEKPEASQAQEEEAPKTVREGNRWVGERPPAEEVAAWFVDNVRLHEGLEHRHYIGGIVLIGQNEKLLGPDGDTWRIVWVPYPRVDTRVAYFYDWCEVNDLTPAIEPVAQPRIRNTPGMTNENLPAGFFRVPIQNERGQWVQFIGHTRHAAAYKPDLRAGARGILVRESESSRLHPELTHRGEADQHAVARAETGAVGRALGLMGMLIIPGSGVATAEDIVIDEATQAALRGTPEPSVVPDTPSGGEVPKGEGEQPTPPSSLRDRAAELIARLESDHPEALETVSAWAKERKINLTELEEGQPQLRGVVKQLERAVAAATKE